VKRSDGTKEPFEAHQCTRSNSTIDLNGRTALITGGSSGIGLAAAMLFAAHGARVAVTGRDEEKLAAAQARIGPQALALGERSVALRCWRGDRGRRRSCGAAVMKLHADLARPALVHAARLPWIPSPTAGVERRMLFRLGGEQAVATSIVRYAAGSSFPSHAHPGSANKARQRRQAPLFGSSGALKRPGVRWGPPRDCALC
jgi:hypothetical protein